MYPENKYSKENHKPPNNYPRIFIRSLLFYEGLKENRG